MTKMSNYDRIRVLICDHLNLARGKYLSTETLENSIRLCLGIYAVDYQRQMLAAPGSGLLDGLPDMEARFDQDRIHPAWEENVGVVIADLFAEEESLALCPRAALKRALTAWQNIGYSVEVGIEFEAYLFKKDKQHNWLPYDVPGAYVYGTGPTADPAGIIEKIWQQSKTSGFQVNTIHSEFDPGQFEFTLKHKGALQAIDEAFLFRLMVMELCNKAGYKMSFMPKPIQDRGGSGFHINFSLLKQNGDNAFADTGKDDGLSALCKHCISGLLHHHKSLAAIQAPSVNSHRRLRPGSLSGYWANWGYDHRGTTVRIPQDRKTSTRIEHRLADGAANPYIATAASLYAALLGRQNHYPLAKAESKDCLTTSDASESVAETLGQSLQALQEDVALSALIGDSIVQHHLAIKQNEWQRYLAHTSDWEMNEYFHFL